MSTYNSPNNQLTGRLPPQSMLRQRYLITSIAGRGGMSAVYKAVDRQQANRVVAIKEMSQSFMSEDERDVAIARFRQEYELLHKLHHANLPAIYEMFNEGDRFYMVMDFIDGKTLFELLKRNGGQPLPTGQVIEYAIQLCDVLSYLHAQRPPIIFRDLKPTNVMIRSDGRLFLIDFGIARFFKEGQQQDTVLLGSPGYAPPEQHGTAQTNPRSDLYALGATLHCCLTGRDPFNHPEQFVFPPIRQFNALVPADLDALILRMLAPDERYRPASALEVQQALLAFRQRAAEETSNLPPMMAGMPAMASAPTQYPLPLQPAQQNFASTATNQPPGYRPTVPVMPPANAQPLAATVLASPARPPQQNRASLYRENVWSAKFLLLFVLILVLTLVGSVVAFNITNPYHIPQNVLQSLVNPPGLDHAVEMGLALVYIIVALAAIAFVRNALAIALLFVSALAVVPAAFAFFVQAVRDYNLGQGNVPPFLSQINPPDPFFLAGLVAASVVLLLWVLRRNGAVERITLLVAFGVPLICMLLLKFTTTSDFDVSRHLFLLVAIIALIQGVLIAARTEQVKGNGAAAQLSQGHA